MNTENDRPRRKAARPDLGTLPPGVQRAAAEFGDKVVFREIDTLEKQARLEWGHADALFIDDRQVRTAPPPSYDKIHKLIARSVRKL